jgi:hypothetical protein
MQYFNYQQLEKELDGKDFTLDIQGDYGIPELCELVEFLKEKKANSIKTQFKVGDYVQRAGYSDERGEVLEVEIEILDSGNEIVRILVENCGSAFESEFELFKN